MGELKLLNDDALEESAAEHKEPPTGEPIDQEVSKDIKLKTPKASTAAPKQISGKSAGEKKTGAANSAVFLRVLAEFPIAVMIIIAFLLWGFLWNGFHVSWTLFLLVPLFHSLIEAISHKNASRFAYPVLVIFVYCLLGCAGGLWHPYWVLFLSIPVYYTVTSRLTKKK